MMFSLSKLASYIVFITLILVSVNYSTVQGKKANKYTGKANLKNLEDEERPFRMKKTNLLWNKAKEKLHGQKLAEAYSELEFHDKREAELKKMRSHGLDKAGAMEEKVLQSYKRLMELYGLDDKVAMKKNIDNDDVDAVTFQDTKLMSMWLRAKDAGFSGKDLEMLRQEFEHQQMKIDEYNFIHGQESNVIMSENEIGERDEEEQGINDDRKEKKKDITAGYMRLEGLSDSLPRQEQVFQDMRVNIMWEMAKKTNWTQTQLEDFKEELSHLDHKLFKQTHYAEKVQDSIKKYGEDPDDLPDNHKHIRDTASLINKRVDKIHGELKTRLDKSLRHVEL